MLKPMRLQKQMKTQTHALVKLILRLVRPEPGLKCDSLKTVHVFCTNAHITTTTHDFQHARQTAPYTCIGIGFPRTQYVLCPLINIFEIISKIKYFQTSNTFHLILYRKQPYYSMFHGSYKLQVRNKISKIDKLIINKLQDLDLCTL